MFIGQEDARGCSLHQAIKPQPHEAFQRVWIKGLDCSNISTVASIQTSSDFLHYNCNRRAIVIMTTTQTVTETQFVAPQTPLSLGSRGTGDTVITIDSSTPIVASTHRPRPSEKAEKSEKGTISAICTFWPHAEFVVDLVIDEERLAKAETTETIVVPCKYYVHIFYPINN